MYFWALFYKEPFLKAFYCIIIIINSMIILFNNLYNVTHTSSHLPLKYYIYSPEYLIHNPSWSPSKIVMQLNFCTGPLACCTIFQVSDAEKDHKTLYILYHNTVDRVYFPYKLSFVVCKHIVVVYQQKVIVC